MRVVFTFLIIAILALPVMSYAEEDCKSEMDSCNKQASRMVPPVRHGARRSNQSLTRDTCCWAAVIARCIKEKEIVAKCQNVQFKDPPPPHFWEHMEQALTDPLKLMGPDVTNSDLGIDSEIDCKPFLVADSNFLPKACLWTEKEKQEDKKQVKHSFSGDLGPATNYQPPEEAEVNTSSSSEGVDMWTVGLAVGTTLCVLVVIIVTVIFLRRDRDVGEEELQE